jgi:hypothetical protein
MFSLNYTVKLPVGKPGWRSANIESRQAVMIGGKQFILSKRFVLKIKIFLEL